MALRFRFRSAQSPAHRSQAITKYRQWPAHPGRPLRHLGFSWPRWGDPALQARCPGLILAATLHGQQPVRWSRMPRSTSFTLLRWPPGASVAIFSATCVGCSYHCAPADWPDWAGHRLVALQTTFSCRTSRMIRQSCRLHQTIQADTGTMGIDGAWGIKLATSGGHRRRARGLRGRGHQSHAGTTTPSNSIRRLRPRRPRGTQALLLVASRRRTPERSSALC